MLTLKAIRKTALYKALMRIPGVELMEIDKEIQAVTCCEAQVVLLDNCDMGAAFYWNLTPQGHYFWEELAYAQCDHHGVAPWKAIPCA